MGSTIYLLTTFPQRAEFDKARRLLDTFDQSYRVISPDPGYELVGTPSLAMDRGARLRLLSCEERFTCSGWVDYRPPAISVPGATPPEFEEDVFGQAAIMLLTQCVADGEKVRVIAHISGDLTEVFPYLNAVMQSASYNKNGHIFTFMDAYRMISVYPRRITVAKADDLVDAWRTLEALRCRVNETWARRTEIEPSHEMRKRPPALEIFRRLPRTNCRRCGEPTCLAFAVQVWQGRRSARECAPVFEGEHGHLKDGLLEICAGLGVGQDPPSPGTPPASRGAGHRVRVRDRRTRGCGLRPGTECLRSEAGSAQLPGPGVCDS